MDEKQPGLKLSACWPMLASEALGTCLFIGFVAFAVWFAEQWSGHDVFFRSAAYSLEVGLGIWALLLLFGPRASSYFNPAIALSQGFLGEAPWPRVVAVVMAQVVGALGGALLVSLATGPGRLDAIMPGSREASLLREFLATFGLVLLYAGTRRLGWKSTGAFVAAASTLVYWVPGVTYFASPALVLASMVHPAARPEGYLILLTQLVAVLVAGLGARWLYAESSRP